MPRHSDCNFTCSSVYSNTGNAHDIEILMSLYLIGTILLNFDVIYGGGHIVNKSQCLNLLL